MRSSGWASLLWVGPALLLLGCASLGLAVSRALPDQAPECPGALVPTEEMFGDFLLEQAVRVQGEGFDWALTLVSQKRGPTLVLVGLDPFGAKLFTVTQRGTEVTVERPGGRLPLPPINLLRDLHRVRFSPPGTPPEPGVTIVADATGALRIHHAACGYDTTLVTVRDDTLPAP